MAHGQVEGVKRTSNSGDGDERARANGVRSFVDLAFKVVDMELEWRGQGVDEIGVCTRTGTTRVRVNPPLVITEAEADAALGALEEACEEFAGGGLWRQAA